MKRGVEKGSNMKDRVYLSFLRSGYSARISPLSELSLSQVCIVYNTAGPIEHNIHNLASSLTGPTECGH